jgi:hypothetical protein
MDSGLALRAPRNDGEYQIRLSNSEVTNSQAASPVLFEAPGAPFVPFPSKHNEGSGAPSGAAYFVVRALLVEERGADRRATGDFHLRLICGVLLPAAGPAFSPRF